MIRLSLEIPTKMLKEWSPLVDLDFVLAHKVLGDEKYASHFNARPPGRELILDNSTHEYGSPIGFSSLFSAADLVGADVVIAPDIVNPNIDEAQHSQNIAWMAEAVTRLAPYDVGAVWSGTTKEQRRRYLDACLERCRVLFFSFHMEDRVEWWNEFVSHSDAEFFNRIHLLGMISIKELRRWVEISKAFEEFSFSFDTSKAIRLGLQGVPLDSLEETTYLRGDVLKSKHVLDAEVFTDEVIKLCTFNIKYLRAICHGEA